MRNIPHSPWNRFKMGNGEWGRKKSIFPIFPHYGEYWGPSLVRGLEFLFFSKPRYFSVSYIYLAHSIRLETVTLIRRTHDLPSLKRFVFRIKSTDFALHES